MKPKTHTSEHELWSDFRTGDPDALRLIYEQFAPVLYNYGYKIAQDRALTEDCLQDVFLTIIERREHLSPTTSIKFYLFRALRREIVHRLQHEQRRMRRLGNGELEPGFAMQFSAATPSWLDERMSQEQSEQFLKILNELPPRQKEAIFLRFYDDLSYEEIAGVMEIEQSSAYKIVYKALAALQRRLPAWTLAMLGGVVAAWIRTPAGKN